MISKASFAVVVVIMINAQSMWSAVVQGTEPQYKGLVKTALKAWKTAKQRDVTITWNAKAPKDVMLVTNAQIFVEGDTLVALSGQGERHRSFAAYFTQDKVLVADSQLQTLEELLPFEPRDGGTTSALPAELVALRMLGMANIVPYLKTLRHKRLAKAEEQQMSEMFYPDTPDFAQSLGKEQTTLSISSQVNSTTYEWADAAGLIAKVETKSCNDDEIAKRRKEFAWTASNWKSVPVPRISAIVSQLVDDKIITSREGVPVAFGKSGARDATTLAPDEIFSSEMSRIRVQQKIGAITVSRAAPLQVREIRALRDKKDVVRGRRSTSLETDDTQVLNLTGQKWLITISIPGLNAGDRSAESVVRHVETIILNMSVDADK